MKLFCEGYRTGERHALNLFRIHIGSLFQKISGVQTIALRQEKKMESSSRQFDFLEKNEHSFRFSNLCLLPVLKEVNPQRLKRVEFSVKDQAQFFV